MKALKSIANRLFIILLALDQLVCGVIWLRPDHTISGEVGYAAGAEVAIPLDTIRAYLVGLIAITGGTCISASLLEL